MERTFGEVAREVLKSANDQLEMKPSRLLIQHQKPDKHAAAERFAIIEDTMNSWYAKINLLNNREMSEDLINMYEELYMLMIKIQSFEKSIILERR